MRLFFTFLTFILFIQINFGQDDFYKIINSQNHFPSIIAEAEAYFAEKHPGLKNSELCEGEHRDGTFVKYMRWKNFWQHRLNEDGTLGDITAYNRNKNDSQRSSGPFDDMEWTNFGIPINLGGHVGVGRTTGVDFHPTNKDIFIVATAVGGIWRTEDGGKSYANIGDNLPTLAIGTVLMDHTDTNVLYASTGDRVTYGLHGVGLYKSIDGGTSWQATSLTWPFADKTRIYKMIMHPENSKVIYAATGKGLYKTEDGFNTFEIIDPLFIHDVVFKPKDPSVIYYTTDKTFRKSSDGGISFETLDESFNGIARIAVSNADPERVYYTKGPNLYQSFDSGQNFSETIDISELDNRVFGYVLMSDVNPDFLYGGYFSTWKSEDNGQSWSEITCFTGADEVHVDNHFAAQNPLEPGYIYFCNDGGLYKHLENPCQDCQTCRNSYEDLSGGMMISQFYDISHSQQNINLVAGGTQDNSSYFRNDHGLWEYFAPTGDGMTNHIDPTDDAYRYWEYQYGGIRRNTNGRNSCISCNIPNNEGSNGGWDTPFQLDPNNPEVIMAGFTRVYRSIDRGDTWKQASSTFGNGDPLDHLKIAPSNSDYVYVTRGPNLYQAKTATNHTLLNWSSSRALPFNGPTELVVSQQDAKTIYVTRGDFVDGGKVYVSYNEGVNWENISGSLPNVPANALVNIDDDEYDNVLIVGTDAGVFYRDASMEDWEEYGSLPHTYVSDIEIQKANKLIRIGTYGRSMFQAPMPDNVCLSANPPDSDGDGVCDAYDICPEGDDNLDLNQDGVPDDCEPSCFASGISDGQNHIEYFSFGAFTNTSANSSYSNYTHFTIQVVKEEYYRLEMGLDWSYPADRALAWIDYNQDNEFSDDELLHMGAYNEFHIAGAKFIVPPDAKLGKTVLRIRNIGVENAPADPCGEYPGEVEDYGIEILESGITSIENNGVNFGFELFPNPASDLLNIKTQAYDGKEIEMSIVSIDGKNLFQTTTFQVLDGETHSIDISGLPPGLFFVKLKSGKYQSVKKLVVR